MVLAAAAAALFALPLAMVVLAGAEYVGFAGESLAYRYFASARIHDGEGARIWLPQGHLASLIQHMIYFFIDTVFRIPPQDFHSRFQAFGIAYGAIVDSINAAILLVAARQKSLRAGDLWLLAFTALAALFATRTAGFYYSTLPDYYHLNLVIVTGSVALFLVNLRSTLPQFTWGRAALSGIWIGLAASNKISMLPIAAAALLPFLCGVSRATTLGFLFWRMGIAVLMALAAIGFVFLGFYLFEARSAVSALRNVANFIADPGIVEPGFVANLPLFLFGYSYAYIIGLSLAVFAVGGFLNTGSFRREPGLALLHAAIFLLALIYAYFVLHRPAGTTFFESSSALVGLIAMALALVQHERARQILVAVVILAATLFSVATFMYQQTWGGLKYSSVEAEIGWNIYNRAQSIGVPVVVVIPDNNYAWGIPEVIFLKGLSDFPSWTITTGSRYLNRLAAPIAFRTEQGGRKPNEPYPADATILWYDRLDLVSLPQRYPALGQAIADRNCESWKVQSAGFGTTIAATLCPPTARTAP